MLLIFQHVAEAAYLMAPLEIVQGALYQQAEIIEILALRLIEGTRLAVYQTEGAEHHSVQRPQGATGVEHHMGWAEHQRVVGKAGIDTGIRHLHDAGLQNGVATEGVLPADFA